MKQNLIQQNITLLSDYQIAIVVSDYYQQVSNQLLGGAKEVFKSYPNIQSQTFFVSGSFELPIVCQRVLKEKNFDAAIALGVIVQGETRHFDYVCSGVTNGLMQAMLDCSKVISFGVLTVENLKQAEQRAQVVSSKMTSNKGVEAAYSLIRALSALESN